MHPGKSVCASILISANRQKSLGDVEGCVRCAEEADAESEVGEQRWTPD